ncbi:hypothetical protein [Aureibacter tunicatorum]|uniref:Uncharacterized protein n=1 Tax=Aureibacter tunicatorum TaxID=866807 RepID=A0AAE3XNW2_9BACT|nr:hypothetical protein [Aureibacter tunicatorum]MDR6241371.1 hypothetical protein [Aureibacter tunicatorum]BDD06784.1 hypothetical protein AUTU_42670 [Aureibacter tunicatorum]
MKGTVFYFIILFSISSYCIAQEKTLGIELTKEHIQVTGTKVSIIKPDDTYDLSAKFLGLSSKSNHPDVIIMDFKIPFDNMQEKFYENSIDEDDKLIIEEDLVMNGYQAKLLKMIRKKLTTLEAFDNPDAEPKKKVVWTLLYGDEKFCVMASSVYLFEEDGKHSKNIEKSLRSIVYNSEQKSNPLDSFPFEMNVENSPLKLAGEPMAYGAGFSLDGKMPTKDENKTSCMVMFMNLPFEKSERESIAIRSVKKPWENHIEVEKVSPVKVGELEGYEVIGYESTDNGKQLKYAFSLFSSTSQYLIYGSTFGDFERNLKIFKDFSSTFKLK